jgi:hypothetical protein
MSLVLEDQAEDDRFVMSLQATEQSVLAAASRILAARIACGACTPENRKSEVRWAIKTAIEMANIIDANIRCEHEM